VACAHCDGVGTLDASVACTPCGGTGSLRSSVWFGWMSTLAPCPQCDGQGRVSAPCGDCHGAGRHSRRYQRRVRFPAGARDGDVLSADAAGPGADGIDGTLELHLRVSEHPLFTVDEADSSLLRCQMPVDGFAWLAETWTDVPTLDGAQQMRLRRGHLTYRLRGQGLPLERGSAQRGDYLVTIMPRFADTLGPRQQALLEELAANAGGDDEPADLRAWRRAVSDRQRGRPAPSR
jgi:molecular chaperone DnaJ